MQQLTMLPNAVYSAIANLNGFEKPKSGGEKYFKIMAKLVETLNRSTTLSMFYIACCSVVLMHYNG